MHDTDQPDGITVHLQYIRAGIDELRQLQRAQNGRLGKAETRIAVLEDRSPGRSASIWGSVAGGVAGGLVAGVKALLGGGQ